jgi:hypothetical protein
MRYISAHLILVNFITLTILGEEYVSLSSSLCSFLHSPVAPSLLEQNILISTLFSNTLCLVKVKCKAIPLQALTGPGGSRSLRLPDFKTVGTWRWQGCQPYAPAAFTSSKYLWYSFLL